MRFMILAALSAAACATAPHQAPLRIAASHYASMNGVAVGNGEGSMTCARDAITGSHILHWYCRFGQDAAQYQLSAPILFSVR